MPEGPARVTVGQDLHQNSHLASSSHMQRADPLCFHVGFVAIKRMAPPIKRTETPPLSFIIIAIYVRLRLVSLINATFLAILLHRGQKVKLSEVNFNRKEGQQNCCPSFNIFQPYFMLMTGIFETVQRSFGLATSNWTMEIASVGQRTTHKPQRIHFSSSMIMSAPPRQFSAL